MCKGSSCEWVEDEKEKMGATGWLPYGVYLVFGIEVVGEIRVEIESMDHVCIQDVEYWRL